MNLIIQRCFKLFIKTLFLSCLIVVAVPYSFGFASGFFDSLLAGYVAGGLTGATGLCIMVVMAAKGFRRGKNSNRRSDGPTCDDVTEVS